MSKLEHALDAVERGLLDPYFAERIAPAFGHWFWTGSLNAYGYGRDRRRSTAEPMAHRGVHVAIKGPIPAGLDIDHICCARSCVNPACTEPVTKAENNQRADDRGRGRAAFQRNKTHCPRGHELTPENTYTYPRGGRTCIICKRAALRADREAARANV